MQRFLFLFLLFAATSPVQAQLTLASLKVENQASPIALHTRLPRFGWQITSDKRGTVQTAYEIIVKDAKSTIWTSKVNTNISQWVAYQGPPLVSDHRYEWQLRVWDNHGRVSNWQSGFFMTSLFDISDWKAAWISSGLGSDTVNGTAPMLRKAFETKKKIQTAYVYIAAMGAYEAFMNGQRIGDSYLSPGWTSYQKRLQFHKYEVTNLVARGKNAIGAYIGSGWYRTTLGWVNHKNLSGSTTALMVQLVITYTDGTQETILSDDTWKAAESEIRFSEIYDGETIDDRLRKPNWATATYDDTGWTKVQVQNFPKNNLLPAENEPIRQHESFTPIKIFKTPKGELVADFGQNLVGWVRLKATGNSGTLIKLQFAEVLDKAGNFYTENLRAAKCTDTWTLDGRKDAQFEPHFTFHGFRYVKLEGYPGEITPENIKAIALYSDMEPTGSFECSDSLLNQLQHNIQWGQRGNFLDVPTDCPQRDERLGWTGDAQAFSRTAMYNFDSYAFFSKWLKDVATDQLPSGMVPWVVPNVLSPLNGGSAGWADAATIIPWNLYLAYGDKRILENQYSSMKAWVQFMQDKSKNDLWNTGHHFGDWLFYDVDNDTDGRSAVTDKYYIAQCFFIHSTQNVLNAAKILGNQPDIDRYTELLQRLKSAFLKEYVTPNGRLVSSTQTAYVLALQFDLLPESQRDQAAKFLVDNIKSYKNHLTTGFLGTPYICHVLTRFGYPAVAYDLLLQKTYPSWLYPVTMGATTIWERWDGIKTDGSFQATSMNSFNHYAYGAIGDWMYRNIAGIDHVTDEPAYTNIIIHPQPGGSLTRGSGILHTLYGKVRSEWTLTNDGTMALTVEIPVNTKATIHVPTSNIKNITDKKMPIEGVKDFEWKVTGDVGELRVGSGIYQFEIKK